MIKNPILSSLYEQFGHGWLASDMGLPTFIQWYYFAITAVKSKHSAEMTDKIRVYLVREDSLQNLPDISEMNFRDSKSGEEAFRALQAMAALLPNRNEIENRGFKKKKINIITIIVL
eukprot:c14173_g1_i2.p1 GENE.c14173_g1_i2~~c14173_g1_i2.p1  ORF type:complete len:117 (+),score=28.38 c14173_g1_i2:46-396(+)